MKGEVLLAFGKASFCGEEVDDKDLLNQATTIEVRSNLKILTSDAWRWPTNPKMEFADHLGNQPEGIYRVFGKRVYQNVCREYLCDLILGTKLKNVWFFPNEFKDAPLFELFYCSNVGQWIGSRVSRKLLQDIHTYAPMIDDDLQYLQKVFAVGADSGFIYLSDEH